MQPEVHRPPTEDTADPLRRPVRFAPRKGARQPVTGDPASVPVAPPPATRFVPASARRPARRTWFHWLSRPRRVLLTLTCVWILSLADLSFTVVESAGGLFVEMNPIADRLLGGPLWTIVIYKLGLVGMGTVILLFLRRHTVAELGCWFLLAANAYVGVRWYVYYTCTLIAEGHDYVDGSASLG